MRTTRTVRRLTALTAPASGLVATLGCEEEFPLPPVPPTATQPATSPASPEGLTRPDTSLAAPHAGRLLAIPGDGGFIEWDIARGRLYALDRTLEPLTNVHDLRLYVATAAGPKRLDLQDASDTDFENAGWTTDSDLLGDERTTGVLRFTLTGEPLRVRLTAETPTSIPAAPSSAPPTP